MEKVDSVVAVFTNHQAAETAIKKMAQDGFEMKNLSVIGNPNIRAEISHFFINYTFWLNLIFGALAIYLAWQATRKPMQASHDCCDHH